MRIVLDPARCAGHGLCAFLAPEHVELDEWGYPIMATGEVAEGKATRRAKRAVRGCPRRALRLAE
ncbi:MAG: ferredoxin [Mycobacteriales bacterium]